MSDLSKNAEQKYTIDGVVENAPLEIEDVTIEANYLDNSFQPALSIDSFNFVGTARERINNWIANGMNGGVGIFEGTPFKLTLFNNTPNQDSFSSYIDFTNDYKDLLERGTISTKLIADKGLDNFFSQIESTTFGYLFNIGKVTFADFTAVDYVVEKKFNLFEILMSSLVLYLMIKELAESVEKTAETISLVSALLSTSAIPIPVGSVLYAVARAIIQITYTAILLLAIISLAKTLYETLLPPKRQHRTIKMRTALERVCDYFGYNLVSPISELDNLFYLPSNPNLDEPNVFGFINQVKGVGIGIPNTFDYGYNCAEMFQLALNLFNGKLAIVGNDVHLRSKNDPYWIQQSNWNMPSILIEQLEYNTDEMKAERLLTFETDLNDEWTVDNYPGTAYEIRTRPKTIINKDAVLLKGIEEINFNVALPNRKSSLNALENLLKSVGQFIDTLTGIFGGGTSFAQKVNSKIGILKQSNNWHSIPKLMYLSGGTLATNHRDLFNSKTLYDRYHNEKSFVLNNCYGQKKVYRNVRIPFGLTDYQQLKTNPYFLFRGKQAKITKFVWTVGQDFAVVDFYVREPYTKNLEEIYYNPQ
jgi:hypothetical protein